MAVPIPALPTKPAPRRIAYLANHIIATLILLYPNLACRALSHNKLLNHQSLLHNILASLPLMPRIPALAAYLKPALASPLVRVLSLGDHLATVWLCTPDFIILVNQSKRDFLFEFLSILFDYDDSRDNLIQKLELREDRAAVPWTLDLKDVA